MWPKRVEVWREDIVGDWQPALCGVDLLYLKSAAGRFDTLSIRADGTWGWPFAADRGLPPDLPDRLRPRWELSDDRVLSLWNPVAPMPEYGIPEWTREEAQHLVLAVTDHSLTLADSHQTIVFRRLNRQDHDRCKAAEYVRLVRAVRRVVKGSRGSEEGAAGE